MDFQEKVVRVYIKFLIWWWSIRDGGVKLASQYNHKPSGRHFNKSSPSGNTEIPWKMSAAPPQLKWGIVKQVSEYLEHRFLEWTIWKSVDIREKIRVKTHLSHAHTHTYIWEKATICQVGTNEIPFRGPPNVPKHPKKDSLRSISSLRRHWSENNQKWCQKRGGKVDFSYQNVRRVASPVFSFLFSRAGNMFIYKFFREFSSKTTTIANAGDVGEKVSSLKAMQPIPGEY